MSLLSLLERLGIKYESLTSEEKQTYNEWNQAFQKPEATIADLKAFLPRQIEALEHQLMDYENKGPKDLYLKACLRNLKMIQAFILGPEQRKKWLEDYLNKRLNN